MRRWQKSGLLLKHCNSQPSIEPGYLPGYYQNGFRRVHVQHEETGEERFYQFFASDYEKELPSFFAAMSRTNFNIIHCDNP